MAKSKTNKINERVQASLNERGITLAKIAYLYGVGPDTFLMWIKDNAKIKKMIEEDGERYFEYSRKWTPKESEMVFSVFGDPRDYQDIISIME